MQIQGYQNRILTDASGDHQIVEDAGTTRDGDGP